MRRPISGVVWMIWRCRLLKRHDVVIDHAELADAGSRKIHQRRCAEATGADDQHGRLLQRLLAGTAYLVQHDMAGIAFEFVAA